MKRLLYYFVFVGSLIYSGCNLVDLDEAAESGEMDLFDIPTDLPESEMVLNEAFHGGSERTWGALLFQLAGFDGMQDCRLDDTMNIMADGTYQYDGGAVLCGAEDDQRIKTGTWRAVNQGKSIVFDEGTSNEYTAEVTGLENDLIALSGQYLGLTITGVYQIK